MKNLEKYLSILNDEVDGLLLTSRYSRHYGAEFDIAEGVAVVSKNGCRYFTDSRYIESAQKNLKGFDVQDVRRGRDYIARLNEAIEEFGITALGFEEAYMTVEEYNKFASGLKAKLVPYNEKIYAFRGVKEGYEIDRLLAAQRIADRAFAEVLPRIHEGMTELDVQAELIYCMYKNGAHGLSFDPIVVSGPNSSMPHGVAGERRLQAGDFLTMDFGVLYMGYCSDTTRTVAIGYATEEMKKVYETVLQAQLAGIAATKAGVSGQAIDAAARKVISDAGYGEYFGHSYGHSLGLEIHEAPNANMSNTEPMPVGAVISAEPGIYLPGKFGVRIEDVTIVTADGCEDITNMPKELIIL